MILFHHPDDLVTLDRYNTEVARQLSEEKCKCIFKYVRKMSQFNDCVLCLIWVKAVFLPS